MQHWGVWTRRGLAVAAIALTFAVVIPEFTVPVNAATARVELKGKPRHQRADSRTQSQAGAGYVAAIGARAFAKVAVAKFEAAIAKVRATAKPTGVGAVAKYRRALRTRFQAARTAEAKRGAAAPLAAKRVRKKKSKKSPSLSLPLLACVALLPFALMALYLLGADWLRRREPHEARKRARPWLVITRARDR